MKNQKVFEAMHEKDNERAQQMFDEIRERLAVSLVSEDLDTITDMMHTTCMLWEQYGFTRGLKCSEK
jgi:hypothetical protein